MNIWKWISLIFLIVASVSIYLYLRKSCECTLGNIGYAKASMNDFEYDGNKGQPFDIELKNVCFDATGSRFSCNCNATENKMKKELESKVGNLKDLFSNLSIEKDVNNSSIDAKVKTQMKNVGQIDMDNTGTSTITSESNLFI